MGFKAISSDTCIFIRVQDNKLIIIALYLNNILIIIKSSNLINKTKNGIKKAFKVKDSRPVRRILSIEVHRNESTSVIKQSQYARKILREYGISEYRPITTPIDGYESIDPPRPDKERTD